MKKTLLTSVRLLLLFCCLFVYEIVQGQNKDFKLKIVTYRGTVQWEQSFDNKAWTSISGATAANITTIPTATTYYRAKITEEGCSPVFSDVKAAFLYGDTLIGAKLIKGKLMLPAQAVAQNTTCKVVSALEESGIDNNGAFEVLIPDSTDATTLLITNASDSVIMMGHYVTPQSQYIISTETSALALLLLYPSLKPIQNNDKLNYINLYKNEPEFAQLHTEVETLSKNNSYLFSASNTGLIGKLKLLVSKPFNQERFRAEQTQALMPIDIRGGVSVPSEVFINNRASFSYTGQLYKTDNSAIGPRFNLAGSLIRSNSFAQTLFQVLRNRSINIKKAELSFDLKETYNLPPGEYEIRLRSGIARDNSAIDRDALQQNVWELLCLTLTNLMDAAFPLENKCLKSFLDNSVSAFNVFNIYTALEDGSFMYDYILPIIKSMITYLGDLQDPECIIKGSSFGKLLGIINLVDKTIPSGYFITELLASKPDINGCQYLNADYETSSCFTILPVLPMINEKYYTGDTVQLSVISKENDKYYPYTNNIAPFKKFSWFIPGNDGVFAPDGAIIAPDRTLVNGIASIKWVMPCVQNDNSVNIVIPGIAQSLTETVFATQSYTPGAKTSSTGNKQTGEPSKMLASKLNIIILDTLDGLPMLMKRFDITWEPVAGSGNVELNASNPFASSFSWTLGPEVGEQIMKARIVPKNCGWPIKDSVILFKAGTALDTLAIIQSQQWKSTEFMWMSLKLDSAYDVEEETDSCGVLKGKSTYQEIYTTFQPSGDFQWSVKGNYKGEALVNTTTCEKAIVDQSGTESIPLAWKWEYIPSLKIIRVTNTDDNDALDLVKGENFDFQIISLTSTEIEIRGVIPFTGAVTHLKLKAK